MKCKGYLLLSVMLLGGCAAYQLGPLSANHPAYPEAAAAPERPLSKTLAYTRADIPSPQPVSAMPEEQPGQQSAQAEQKTVVWPRGKSSRPCRMPAKLWSSTERSKVSWRR